MSTEVIFQNLELPAGLTFRALQESDAEICAQLVRKVDLAACGETSTTSAELKSDLQSSAKSGFGSWGVFNDSNLVIALLIHNELEDSRGCFIDVFVDPAEPLVTMQETCELLISKVEILVKNFSNENNLGTAQLKTALYDRDLAFLNALSERGFVSHRVFWRLRIDHTDNTDFNNSEIEILDFLNSGITFEKMHEISSEIFQDHYDFHKMAFERWKSELTSGVHDQKLWRIAFVEGEVAGYCWGSRRFEEEGFGYVSSIGVLRKFRGQGIAKALLQDAFARDFRNGMHGSLLHCDSENPNGATALYENAGMRVDRVYVAFRKEIS